MIERCGPESFGSDLVGQFVDGGAEFLEEAPSLVECGFGAVFGFVPG